MASSIFTYAGREPVFDADGMMAKLDGAKGHSIAERCPVVAGLFAL
jgi:hypothetical protein